MLCEPCRQHFSFAYPRQIEDILRIKRGAVDSARNERICEAHRRKLEDECQRYANAVESARVEQNGSSLAPCPWNLEVDTDFKLSIGSSVSVWPDISQQGMKLPWRRVSDLQASARVSSCRMCKVLSAMISYLSLQGMETIPGSSLISSQVLLDQGTCRPTWMRFDVFSEPHGPRSAMLGLHLSTIRARTTTSGMEGCSDTAAVLRHPVGEDTEDQACIGVFSQALAECSSHCVASPGQSPEDGWLPTRLLDVNPDADSPGFENGNSRIRLVERHEIQLGLEGKEYPEYITLSHRWGVNPRFVIRLTEDRLASYKIDGIELQHLPLRFKDAVSLTRRLNVRYLWIDTLCIIQDSTNDWAAEAGIMNKVYTNSLCTLAAADGPNSNSRLFAKRDPLVGAPLVVKQQFTDCTIDFAVVPDWVDLIRRHCGLYSRAWVVQERFLSRRILHLSDFPFYECRCGLQTETCPKSWTTKSPKGKFEFSRFPKQQRDWLFRDAGSRTVIERWWDIVKLYSRCSLTYDSDKMIAIGGIARAFGKITGLDYLSGIWGGELFGLSLLWMRHPAPPRLDRPVGYRAPSWSWASVNGPIYTYPYTYVRRSTIELLSANINPAEGHDEFGNIAGGTLAIRGFVIKIQNFWKRKASLGSLQLSGCRLDFEDQLIDPLDDSSQIYFLPVGDLDNISSNAHTPSFWGIFIQEHELFGPKHKSSDHTRIFQLVGHGMQIEEGGDGHILDAESWGFLCAHYESELQSHGEVIRLT